MAKKKKKALPKTSKDKLINNKSGLSKNELFKARIEALRDIFIKSK